MVLNTGDEYHQDGQSQDPPRVFICFTVSSTLVTSRTDIDLPSNSSRNDLRQDDQSSGPISPTSVRLSNKDLDPAAVDPREGGGDASDPDLPDPDDGAPQIREYTKDASRTNVGHVTDDASRGCHTSPDPQLF